MMAANSRNIKIILMSATMDTHKISQFFQVALYDNGQYERDYIPPIIDLSTNARSYPISVHYLHDYVGINSEAPCSIEDLINYDEPGIKDEMYAYAKGILTFCLSQQLKKNINALEGKTILVFLPGLYEIERFSEVLKHESVVKAFNKMPMKPIICILHSSLSTSEQRKAFEPTSNVKIVLATNVAESSITIPNVTHIIDFCLTKYQVAIKGAQVSSLILDWASKNNCEQRAGRTGRVCPGWVIRLVRFCKET